VVWDKAQDALLTMAGEYKKRFESIERANNLAVKIPPALIIVTDNTDIAEVFAQNISGEIEVDDSLTDESTDEEANGDEGESSAEAPIQTRRKKRTVYTDGKVFPDIPH
jgi:type III restriction enzyme